MLQSFEEGGGGGRLLDKGARGSFRRGCLFLHTLVSRLILTTFPRRLQSEKIKTLQLS